ncbi:MAG: GGDEF domain-containing protein [Candidatus Eremiobacteraeota bacterium]|nr:GGDEF domain-containing protein [Candidatus Eremiobacteraeota bacterium]
MIGQLPWIIGAACAIVAAAVFVWQCLHIKSLQRRVMRAERRIALLSELAPPLTQAARDSAAQTCQRIVERFRTLVPASHVLCFVAHDGRLELAAASDGQGATYLRIGDAYEGEGIIAWTERNACAALIGPSRAPIASGLQIADLWALGDGYRNGPLLGSRDRVWALCVPLTQPRGYGLRPAVIGAVYAERKHDDPFNEDELGTALTVARLSADALQRARFADEVKREAEIDPLTQLLSASSFRKRLREVLEGPRRDVALFFIDTDRFKLWNDTFGHAVGDVLLRSLGQIFADVAATGGFAGRNGGDEFCIVLFDRTKDDAVAVAEALRARVERSEFTAGPPSVPQPRIPITISVGVAHYPVDVPAHAEAPADRLLEAADARMYDAKREGRNRVSYLRARALGTKM